MEIKVRCGSCSWLFFNFQLRFSVSWILLILLWSGAANSKANHHHHQIPLQVLESGVDGVSSHSCIHDQIIEQRKRPGRKVYSVTPQIYHGPRSSAKAFSSKRRALLSVSEEEKDVKQPVRIYLNYDVVGHSLDRDCHRVGDIVKLGEPPSRTFPACNPNSKPPVSGDCWYNCTLDDISGEDKRHRLRKALEQTSDWFRRALAVEPVKRNLR